MIKDNNVYNYDAKDFIHSLYEEFGDNSIEMFFCDFPYTFKGKQRVTANKWDLPIDDNDFFDVAMKMLTEDGVICLTASQPFTSYLVYNHLDCFKYEWVIEKDNGSNFVHVKHQPFKVHESVLVFGKSPTTYNKKEKYMKYNPQMTIGKAYKVNRKGMTENLATSSKYERTSGEYGEERYPRSVLKFNWEKGLHPTQKPVELVKYMINTYTDEGSTVVDICCGSGTTAIASIITNRNFIVNDIEEKYYNITINRVKETYDKTTVLCELNNKKENEMENASFEIIRVKKLKLNPDKETARVVLDIKLNDKIGKLTIPKLNIASLKIRDETSDVKYYDSEADTMYLNTREIMANMLIDIESDGSTYTVKFL